MSLLEINHMKKSFGEVEVLKDISMKVEEGEVFGIIGPSGSGKSTLLRCATGLETPDSGEIHYNGTFGLVFQNFNLFPHFSVLKNIVDAPLRVQKRNKEEVYKEARELLKKMGLADKENAYPFQLSGGQQQRVALARALAAKPAIVLADEPTGNLDSRTSQDVLGLMKMCGRRFAQTIVMITHNDEIAQMADRIIRLEDGTIFGGENSHA